MEPSPNIKILQFAIGRNVCHQNGGDIFHGIDCIYL